MILNKGSESSIEPAMIECRHEANRPPGKDGLRGQFTKRAVWRRRWAAVPPERNGAGIKCIFVGAGTPKTSASVERAAHNLRFAFDHGQ
jgi:hypothetical protein